MNKNKQFKKEYKIAVVANMSAGKSTFINSMFADDVLPAYSEATTDCPIYIYSDDDPTNNKAVVEFLDGKKKVILNKKEVKKHLKLYAKKDDDLDDKYKNVKKIDLFWDFCILKNTKNSSSNFIFIDTPGLNNTGGASKKHQTVTEHIILNEADMLMFLFDYGQLDANLELSKGNLWDLVVKRYQKNKNIKIFFIINKIDLAFDDNCKLIHVTKSKTKDEFYKNLKEFWCFHEQKAVEKLYNIAQKYGFQNPKIFTTSSEYQKIIRQKEISLHDQYKLENIKKLFKEVFKDKWKYEMLKYLQMENIENETRFHIENLR